MIEALSVKNLKCFTQLDLRPGSLTLLAGMNSAGKSTVIQSILLDELARRGARHVPLTGDLGLAMGNASDVLNRTASDREIVVVMVDGDASAASAGWAFPTTMTHSHSTSSTDRRGRRGWAGLAPTCARNGSAHATHRS